MKTFRFTLLWLLGAIFIGAGAAHLVDPDTYAKMVPPYLPAPAALVLVSGLFEIALGVLIFPQKTRPYAACSQQRAPNSATDRARPASLRRS